MKDNLFEILLNLFETSLTQLQKSHQQMEQKASEQEEEELDIKEEQFFYVKSAHPESIRIMTSDELVKLTKASHQFLMRMKLWNIINRETFESIINQLQYSESQLITLRETKWTIRNTLAADLNEQQLAFLDLVLYRTEDNLVAH